MTDVRMSETSLLIQEVGDLRKANKTLADAVDSLKRNMCVMGEKMEEEEEAISNKLMKRLHELKLEKEKLVMEVEREEEFLTNTLQRKLSQLQKEKVELENKLEAEQEFVVNRLHKQMSELQAEKDKLENILETDTEHLLGSISESLRKLRSGGSGGEGEVAVISSLVEKLSLANATLTSKYKSVLCDVEALKTDIVRMSNEKFGLEQRVMRETQKLTQERTALSQLEFDLEVGSERSFNNTSVSTSPSSVSSRASMRRRSNLLSINDAMTELRRAYRPASKSFPTLLEGDVRNKLVE